MKEQLTIQELSAYLPWEVTASNFDFSEVVEITLFDAHDALIAINNDSFRLLLLPLSLLTKYIEHKGERFVPITKLNEMFSYEDMKLVYYINSGLGWEIQSSFTNTALSFEEMYLPFQKLHEWHLDTFGLIPRGLAIDKTTIQ